MCDEEWLIPVQYRSIQGCKYQYFALLKSETQCGSSMNPVHTFSIVRMCYINSSSKNACSVQRLNVSTSALSAGVWQH